jgi:hypothetical protein
MRVLHRSHWWVSVAIAGVLAAGVARAGANTWTPLGAGAYVVANDPVDPYVVYAVFSPGDLMRSADGGRSWTHLARFDAIYSVLVYPADSNTLFIGASDSKSGLTTVFKSTDGGATWAASRTSIYYEQITVLVASPTDGSVYAGSGASLYRTSDRGVTWTRGASLTAAISDLVIHPTDPSTLYAAMDSGYYYPFGGFAESTNTGGSWTPSPHLGLLDRVSAAMDPTNPSRLYLGLASGSSVAEKGLRRSDDGGQTWSELGSGLPADAQVEAVAVDPVNPATVYAGTDRGIYRSRNSGETWLPFSQVLNGASVTALLPSADGKTLRAVTGNGAFSFDLTEGAIDVAATGGGGASGVLSWSADRLAVQTLMFADGGWLATPFEGPVAAWQATAIASSGDSTSRVLWQAGDGRSAVEIVGPAGRESAAVLEAATGWIPADISVAADGTTHLLVTGNSGAMYVATLDSGGSLHAGPTYGPTASWAAIALADAPDGGTWVLWRNPDGRSAVSIHRDGTMESFARFDASADGAVADLAVGADGRARILVTDAAGNARVWTVASDGSRIAGDPMTLPGLAPRRIAAAADGSIRVLSADRGGHGAVTILSASGVPVATHDVPALP